MKATKLVRTVFLCMIASVSYAQELKKDSIKERYYKQRAQEDAKFEQRSKARSKSEDKKFWKEQKEYERKLEKRDEVAYKAYLKGKKDAYTEHAENCNTHCNHSRYYHDHAAYYYHGFYSYERRPRGRSTRTRVIVRAPSIRLGIF